MLCLSDENITDSCRNEHYYILNNHAILESEYCVVHSQKSRQIRLTGHLLTPIVPLHYTDNRLPYAAITCLGSI